VSGIDRRALEVWTPSAWLQERSGSTDHIRLLVIRVGFKVLTAADMKMAVFWVVAPCSLVDVYRRFRGSCCLHPQGDRTDDGAIQPSL
jgi:hypothetical protein